MAGRAKKKRSSKGCGHGIVLQATAEEEVVAGGGCQDHPPDPQADCLVLALPPSAEKSHRGDLAVPLSGESRTEASLCGGSSSFAMPKKSSSVPCRYFQRGDCWNGDSCRFQHAYDGPPAGTAPSNPHPKGARLKKERTREQDLGGHLRGLDFEGSGSASAHPSLEADVKKKKKKKKQQLPQECLDWLRMGSCPRGRTCRYAHPPHAKKEKGMSSDSVGLDALECMIEQLLWLGFGRSGIVDETDSDDDEMEERVRNLGFTDDDVYELSLQGIKPWDPEAWDALAVINDWDYV